MYYSSLVFKWAWTRTYSSSFHTRFLPVNPGSHTTCTAKSNLNTCAPVEAFQQMLTTSPSLNGTLQIIITKLQEQKSMGAMTLNQSVGRSCSIVCKSSACRFYFHTAGEIIEVCRRGIASIIDNNQRWCFTIQSCQEMSDCNVNTQSLCISSV